MYNLELYKLYKIIYNDIDILINESGISFNNNQNTEKSMKTFAEIINFYNDLRLIYKYRDITFAFDIIEWYFLDRARLNEGFYKISY